MCVFFGSRFRIMYIRSCVYNCSHEIMGFVIVVE